LKGKFVVGETGCGEYQKHTNAKTFLSKVAAPDVVKLHRCITEPMFSSRSKLVRQSWEEEHREKKVAGVFFSQYVDMKHFNIWNCGATGILGWWVIIILMSVLI
jgi:hypothetical protein